MDVEKKNRLAVGAIEEFNRRQECHRKEQPASNAGLMDEEEIKRNETLATEMPDTEQREQKDGTEGRNRRRGA